MLALPIQNYLNQFLSQQLDRKISSLQFQTIGGGSINAAYKITIDKSKWLFLKVNAAAIYPGLFKKEKNGLEFISEQQIIRAPAVMACDIIEGNQVLLLEWIENGLETRRFWERFGEQLAKLHSVTNRWFGFEENNYMGALPQENRPHSNWIEFFIDCRLQPQVKMAIEKKHLQKKHAAAFEFLYSKLTFIFNKEDPSLLHGDLWSGNFMCNENSDPVLIDPAVYFGHRSMDLAMTTLFGGFDKSFYEAYHYHFPLPPDYHDQWDACNLYPLLIHLNLFGEGYLSQIESILRRFGL